MISFLQPAILLWFAGVLATPQDSTELLKRAETDLNQGRYGAAIQEALRCADSFGRLGALRERASALTVAGLGEMYSGEYQAAIHNFTDALASARGTKDFGRIVARLNDIGNALYFEGRYSEAMGRYREAMELVESDPAAEANAWARQLTTANTAILYQTLGQFDRALSLYTELLKPHAALAPEEQAQLLTNIGALRRRLGDPQKALDSYRAAQGLYRKISHRDGEIAVLNNIGIVEALEFHDAAAAEATFTTALKLAQDSGDRLLAIHARLYRGESYYRDGLFQESGNDFQAAATLSHELGANDEEWKALYGLARLSVAGGDRARATELLNRAVKLIESLRTNSGTSSLRSVFLKDKRAVYDLLVQLSPTADEAFRWIETSRARTLRDRLQRVDTVSLQQLSRSLPGDTAIVEFWVGEESAAAVWITRTRSGIKRRRRNADESEATQRIAALLSDPQNVGWRESIRNFSSKVLSGIPVLGDAGIRNLIIIPDGALSTVPFEALTLPDSRLLIQRFGISYAPSAYIAVGKRVRRTIRWPWEVAFLGFADPDPGNRGQDIAAPSSAWSRLPEAGGEIAGIARILGGKPTLHIGKDARKEWLQSAGRFTVVHLATHAFADPRDPNLSYILLAPGSAQEKFDYLFLKEVYDLHLSAVDLVTLSACETGVGSFVPGEGQQDLSQAFLAAGAHSVVASLWRVGDKPTKALMLRFYSHLAAGEPVAAALRKAKLEFISQSNSSSHPAYWAAFVLSGDARARISFLASWKLLSMAVVILSAALAGLKLWQKRRNRLGVLVSKNPNDLHG